MSAKLNNIAVLIDADNASANNIGEILKEIAKHGHVSCKRIYGDWGSVHIKGWQEALLKYAIDPMQQFAYVKGKNATDIGLVIDAMDLLYDKKHDGFCLISSDSDFTSLALRIRKNYVKVFGFGKRSTVQSFTQACDQFFYVEDLAADKPKPIAAISSSNKSINNAKTQWKTKQLQTQTHLINTLNKIIKEDANVNNGWSQLSYVASQVNQDKNIKLDRYGYAKFSTLISALRLYDIRRQTNGIWIKLKSQKDLLAVANANKNSVSSKPITKSQLANSDLNLFSANSINIKIVTAPTIDAVLFRVDAKAKVRGDEDMIFYGQTHSEDGSIVLDQQFEDDQSIFEFSCDLSAQPIAINQLNFALSGELDSLDLHTEHPLIELSITDTQDNSVLFSGEFNINNKSGKSLLLFTLSRENKQWRFAAMHQSIDGDLRFLCEKYGVELSDA